ncbi:hypothetical protein ACFVJK_30535 [Streptomyces sp. NPDC127172]|uniref:hypothetical protein n=1 Tax=Streptomyces sp. NPDC127172 TaxID=3345382 RepID=UPI003637AAD8
MRLYSCTGVTALDDAEFGNFTADETGAFDFPDEVSDRLHSFHLHGRPMWETDIERQRRLISEELERRKDPATLLSAVEQLVRAASATAALTAPALAPAPAAPTAPVEPAPALAPAEPAPTAPAEPAPAAPAAPKKPAGKRAAAKPAGQ